MAASLWAGLDPRGPAAASQLDLLWWMLGLSLPVLALFLYLLLRGVLRRRPDEAAGDDAGAGQAEPDERRWLLLGGVVLPAVVVAVVMALTVRAMGQAPEAGPDALRIEVVGHQWWWEVNYPDLGVTTANEVHLPAGVPVVLELTSDDVVHSFWVPQLGGKLDALPERVNRLVLQADEPGEYAGACAEFCGLQHARMRVVVVAHDAGDFEAWVARRTAGAAEPAGAAARGRRVFLDRGCAACHVATEPWAPSRPGPHLGGLASRRLLLASGLAVDADELAALVRDPDGLKDGIEMPPTELPDDELADLVAYLLALR